MSSPLTVGERIILHLSQFSKYQNDYDVPFEVSQDGIASAIRISRAHAAIELKKLKESEDASERLAHIRRGKSRRKVYFLTAKGEMKSQKIREYANKEGIDVKPLLDITRCTGEELWNSLDPELRTVLGTACVFRRPFKRDALPETSISILPQDRDGMVLLPHITRTSILALMDRGMTREGHSFAADYWLKEGDYPQRLFHLVKAGRTTEAEMLIAARGRELLEGPERDLFEVVESIPTLSDRYRLRVNRFMAELALLTDHADECMDIVEQLRGEGGKDAVFALTIKSRLQIESGNAEDALESLTEARMLLDEESVELEIEVARALQELGCFAESRDLLDTLIPKAADNDLRKLAEIQYLLGVAHLRLNEVADSIKYLSKGMGVTKEEDRVRWFSALSEAYLAMGMKEKAAEYRSMMASTGSGSASACPGR